MRSPAVGRRVSLGMQFIVAAIDFSESTSRVVNEAARLAAAAEAHVVVIHVVQMPKFLQGVAGFGGCGKLAAAVEAAADRRLLEITAGLQQRGVNGHALRLTGDPAADLVDQAEKLEALCIVIGAQRPAVFSATGTRSGIGAVLKRARCPVVLVPLQKRSSPSRTEMKTMLVPIDFSRTTTPVVALATELAGRSGARITFLNVTRPEGILEEHTKLEKIVEQVGARRRELGADSLELIGDPASVILAQARRLAADVILMGTHRPTTRLNKGIGRTAREVVRGAECPVMLVPAPKPRVRTTVRRRRTAKR